MNTGSVDLSYNNECLCFQIFHNLCLNRFTCLCHFNTEIILTTMVPSFINVTLRFLKYAGVRNNVSVMETQAYQLYFHCSKKYRQTMEYKFISLKSIKENTLLPSKKCRLTGAVLLVLGES